MIRCWAVLNHSEYELDVIIERKRRHSYLPPFPLFSPFDGGADVFEEASRLSSTSGQRFFFPRPRRRHGRPQRPSQTLGRQLHRRDDDDDEDGRGWP